MLINNLFVTPQSLPSTATTSVPSIESDPSYGTILSIKEGYGFIQPDSGEPNLFFHSSSIEDISFNELREGDCVQFIPSHNDRGPCATQVKRL